MSHIVSLLCATIFAGVVAAPAAAQDPERVPEGPGDIIATRDVPIRNAIIPGEPGRPVLVNPRTIVLNATSPLLTLDPFSDAMGGEGFQPLTDSEAASVFGSGGRMAAQSLQSLDSFVPDNGFASQQGSAAMTNGGSGLGGAISGTVTGATSILGGVLGSVLGGGGGGGQ